MKKTLNVVGAVFIENGKIFYAKRGEAKNPEVAYKYEFIGGKIEIGETPEEALKRELKEEADLDVAVGELVCSLTYEYSLYVVNLAVYNCVMMSDYVLKEHIEAGWLEIANLDPSLWAPADEEILAVIKRKYL